MGRQLGLMDVGGDPSDSGLRRGPARPAGDDLYGADAAGDVRLLLTHRGVLFAGVAVLCALAAVRPVVRPAALAVTGLSVIGFLTLYAAAGLPDGALRAVAVVDVGALGALIVAGFGARSTR